VQFVQGHAAFTFGDSVGSREYRGNLWTKNVENTLIVATDMEFLFKTTEKKWLRLIRALSLVKKRNRMKINDVAKKNIE